MEGQVGGLNRHLYRNVRFQKRVHPPVKRPLSSEHGFFPPGSHLCEIELSEASLCCTYACVCVCVSVCVCERVCV